MITKNIYTVRLLDVNNISDRLREKAGRPDWIIIVQKDVSWSAEAVIPDIAVTDKFDLDVIFDDEFRKTTDVNVGDILTIEFCTDGKDKRHEVEVICIRKDKPINHLQNKTGME